MSEESELKKKLRSYELGRLMFRFSSHYGATCSYCGAVLNASLKRKGNPNKATVDHIICKSAGGDDDLNNLTMCCYRCNSSKNKKSYAVWHQQMQFDPDKVRTFAEMPDGYGPYR